MNKLEGLCQAICCFQPTIIEGRPNASMLNKEAIISKKVNIKTSIAYISSTILCYNVVLYFIINSYKRVIINIL